MSEIKSYEDFLNYYYRNPDAMFDMAQPFVEELVKADDPLAIGRTDYFDPVYGATVELWLAYHSEVYMLPAKTSYIALGDSIKFIKDHVGDVNFHGYLEATDIGAEDTDVPDITDIDNLNPAIVGSHWRDTLLSTLKASWQKMPPFGGDKEWLKKVNTQDHVHKIDEWLFKTCDTPAVDGTNAYPESIDRIISCQAEAHTNYRSAASDPDLKFGEGGVTIDRSASADYDAQVDLPGSPYANRALTLEMIDDIMVECKRYSLNKNFIMLTDDKQLNNIQRIIDPKQRYLDSKMDYQHTLNGVSTRSGVKGGFSIGGLITCGLTVPVFTSYHCPVEGSGNGNFYIMDMDEIEIRVALPNTFLSTDNAGMLHQGKLRHEHLILEAMQLIPTKFKSHGAIKFLT